MPAEAGIQAVGNNTIFEDLDSRLHGNDGLFPFTTQSLEKEEKRFYASSLGMGRTLYPAIMPPST
jgi:hypothetical protein